MISNLDKELEFILRKMCSCVNADFDKIDFKKNGWFREYEWTQKQENEFAEWLVNALYKDKKLRGIFQFCTKNKESLKKNVAWFLLMYGWKLKNESNNSEGECVV